VQKSENFLDVAFLHAENLITLYFYNYYK